MISQRLNTSIFSLTCWQVWCSCTDSILLSQSHILMCQSFSHLEVDLLVTDWWLWRDVASQDENLCHSFKMRLNNSRTDRQVVRKNGCHGVCQAIANSKFKLAALRSHSGCLGEIFILIQSWQHCVHGQRLVRWAFHPHWGMAPYWWVIMAWVSPRLITAFT